MKKNIHFFWGWLILMALVFGGGCRVVRHDERLEPPIPPGPCACRYSVNDLATIPLEALGREFRRLHAFPSADCWKFGSGLHLAMNALLNRYPSQISSPALLRKTMGIPDRIADSKAPPLGFEQSFMGPITSGQEVWIYDWRKGHDFLWAKVEGKKLLVFKWFMAYE